MWYTCTSYCQSIDLSQAHQQGFIQHVSLRDNQLYMTRDAGLQRLRQLVNVACVQAAAGVLRDAMMVPRDVQPRCTDPKGSLPVSHAPSHGTHPSRQHASGPAIPQDASGAAFSGLPSQMRTPLPIPLGHGPPHQLHFAPHSFSQTSSHQAHVASTLTAAQASQLEPRLVPPMQSCHAQGSRRPQQGHISSGIMLSMPIAIMPRAAAGVHQDPQLPHAQSPLAPPPHGDGLETQRLWRLAQGLVRAPACPAQGCCMLATAQPLRFTAGGMFFMPSLTAPCQLSSPSANAHGTQSHQSEAHRDKRARTAGPEVPMLPSLGAAHQQHLAGANMRHVITGCHAAPILPAGRCHGSSAATSMPPVPSGTPHLIGRCVAPTSEMAAPRTQHPGASPPQAEAAAEKAAHEMVSSAPARHAVSRDQGSSQEAGSSSGLAGLIADICTGLRPPQDAALPLQSGDSAQEARRENPTPTSAHLLDHQEPAHEVTLQLQQRAAPQSLGRTTQQPEQPNFQPSQQLPQKGQQLASEHPLQHLPEQSPHQPEQPHQQLHDHQLPLQTLQQQQQPQAQLQSSPLVLSLQVLPEQNLPGQPPQQRQHESVQHALRGFRASGVFRGHLSSSTSTHPGRPSTSGSPPSMSSRPQADASSPTHHLSRPQADTCNPDGHLIPPQAATQQMVTDPMALQAAACQSDKQQAIKVVAAAGGSACRDSTQHAHAVAELSPAKQQARQLSSEVSLSRQATGEPVDSQAQQAHDVLPDSRIPSGLQSIIPASHTPRTQVLGSVASPLSLGSFEFAAGRNGLRKGLDNSAGPLQRPQTQMLTGDQSRECGGALEQPSSAALLQKEPNIAVPIADDPRESQPAAAHSEMGFAFGSAQLVGQTLIPVLASASAPRQSAHHARTGHSANSRCPLRAEEGSISKQRQQQLEQAVISSGPFHGNPTLPEQESPVHAAAQTFAQGFACTPCCSDSRDTDMVPDSEETRASSQPGAARSDDMLGGESTPNCSPIPSANPHSQGPPEQCMTGPRQELADMGEDALLEAEPGLQETDRRSSDDCTPVPSRPSHALQGDAQGISAEGHSLHDGKGTFARRRQCRRARPTDSDSLELRPAKRHRLASVADSGQQHTLLLGMAEGVVNESDKHNVPEMAEVKANVIGPHPANQADVPQAGHRQPPTCLACDHTDTANGCAPSLAQHEADIGRSNLLDEVSAPHPGPMQPSVCNASPSHSPHTAARVGGREVLGSAAPASKQHASGEVGTCLAERASRHDGLAGLAALLLQQSNPRESEQLGDDMHAQTAKPGPRGGAPSSADQEPRTAVLQPPLLGTSKVSFSLAWQARK